MKKLFCLLLSLCLLLGLTACAQEESTEDTTTGTTTEETTVPEETTEETAEQTTTEETEPEDVPSSPLLYKVTDEAGNTVYLFGSIHVGIDEMYPLPDYVMDAYNESDAVAFELDQKKATSDYAAMAEAMQALLLTDGTKISDHISEETYEAAVEILRENGTYMSAFDMYKPVLWSTLIDNFMLDQAGADAELGIDLYFNELAYDDGKPVYEVESMQEQYTLLANLSMELQVYLLESSVASYGDPEAAQVLLDMCHAWAMGDAEQILALSISDTSEMDEQTLALYEEYSEALEGDRNVNMAAYAEEALASGETVFIVVGAAHVVGDDGMAARLTQAGYTVEQVKD